MQQNTVGCSQKCTGCGKTAKQSPLRLGRPHANCSCPTKGKWVEVTLSKKK